MNAYNFTERVRKVLAMAREESMRLHHEYVGTEHVLLGLIREGEGVAATVLQNLSVDLDDLQQKIEAIIKKGDPTRTTGPDLPYTSRAKKVLELAMSEARELDHSYVGTEHLLLGLLREEKGIAAQVLTDSGVTLDHARAETVRILGTERTADTAASLWKARLDRESSTSAGPARFSERFRTVAAAARKVAAERNVSKITPVHIALALLEHGEGVANVALERLGLDVASATLDLNDLAPMGTEKIPPGQEIELDPTLALLGDVERLRKSEDGFVAETHHLLMALIASSPEVAGVFSAQGISLIDVRDESRKIVG